MIEITLKLPPNSMWIVYYPRSIFAWTYI